MQVQFEGIPVIQLISSTGSCIEGKKNLEQLFFMHLATQQQQKQLYVPHHFMMK